MTGQSNHSFWRENGFRLLAAFIFAVFVYVTVSLQLQEEQVIENVPVKIIINDPNLTLIQERIPTVSVTIKGSKEQLRKIKSNRVVSIKHTIPQGTSPGIYSCILTEDDVYLPRGLYLSDKDAISPNRVNVLLARVITKEVPVRLRFDRSSLPERFAIKAQRVNPMTVQIRGPQPFLENIEEVVTEEVSFRQNPSLRNEFQLRLIKPEKAFSVIPEEVSAVIELHQTKDVMQFNNIPVFIMAPVNSKIRVKAFKDLPSVSFIIEGNRQDLSFIDVNHVKAFIQIDDNAIPGEALLPVNVWVNLSGRSSYRVRSINPEALRVLLERIP